VLVNIKVHSALENSAAQMTDKDIFIPAGSAAKDHMDMDIRLRPGPIHIAQRRWGVLGPANGAHGHQFPPLLENAPIHIVSVHCLEPQNHLGPGKGSQEKNGAGADIFLLYKLIKLPEKIVSGLIFQMKYSAQLSLHSFHKPFPS
jgi:hypothetical protein